jgi:hypothetical protein
VTFIATTAVPAVRSGHSRKRGEVIIDFFQLNAREQLHRERARMITMLRSALKFIEADIEVANNERLLRGPGTTQYAPHSMFTLDILEQVKADRGGAQKRAIMNSL